VPTELDVVLFNSWMMSWMTKEDRTALNALIGRISRRRSLWWVTYEWPTAVAAFADDIALAHDASVLGLQRLTADGVTATKLAHIGHHGTWIEWFGGDNAPD